MSFQLVEQLQQKAVPVNQLCRVFQPLRLLHSPQRVQVQPTVCGPACT